MELAFAQLEILLNGRASDTILRGEKSALGMVLRCALRLKMALFFTVSFMIKHKCLMSLWIVEVIFSLL